MTTYLWTYLIALSYSGIATAAFSVGRNFPGRCLQPSLPRRDFHTLIPQHRRLSPLCMATVAPELDSSDPFAVLGLDPNDGDSLDKKVIKRAYKRLALKYHPDVATNRDSTSAEKQRASDQFAKINAAYETLLGKREGNFASSYSASSGSRTDWTPPHRRKPGQQSSSSSSSSSSYGGGTSWEDFMPKYDDAQYDAGGDSMGAIFADLMAGAAGSVAGSRGGSGVLQDFVEFLERNVDGYGGGVGGSSSRGDDAELNFLLQTGTVDEVAEELDDTELVVQQLSTKMRDLENELLTIQADLAASSRFSEKMVLEERESECNARKGVVDNYLRKARKRLLALQTRYKQLIVGGANDSKAGGRKNWSSTQDSARSTSTRTADQTASSSRQRAASSNEEGGDKEDAWKTEGFGSSGRGRGSSRRSSSRRTSSTQSTSSNTSRSQTTSPHDDDRRASRQSSARPSSPQSTPSSSDYNVPPHRRSRPYQAQDDKERLRELKVDDEFEKLKKDLGL